MISPPTESFYVLQCEGEAAEWIAGMFSPGAINDIRTAVLISDDFKSDIEAMNELDIAVEAMKHQLHGDLVENSTHNPLYVPASQAAVEGMMDDRGEEVEFTGMDGNPFTLKAVSVTTAGNSVIEGRAICKPFDLPAYEDLMNERTLN